MTLREQRESELNKRDVYYFAVYYFHLLINTYSVFSAKTCYLFSCSIVFFQKSEFLTFQISYLFEKARNMMFYPKILLLSF